MNISALSPALIPTGTQALGEMGVALLDKSLENMEAQGQGLVNMIDAAAMERSIRPYVGGNMDVRI